MKTPFTHLHVHSEFSLLDGFGRLESIVAETKQQGMEAIALTDHGVMFGVLDFYKICRREGIKPIIGCEIYVAPRNLEQKDSQYDKDPYHLLLLAKNNTGYKNLIKIVSKGFVDGFYYKPRVDRDYLKSHSEGIICLSACLSGEIPRAIRNGHIEKAEEIAIFYRDIFGSDNFYLEIMDHKLSDEALVSRHIIEMSQKLNIPLVATNDVHYVKKSDAEAHDVLLCIQTGSVLDDESRMRYPGDEFYLKSSEEMKARFAHVPEAIENTAKIAAQCEVTFDLESLHLPEFELPEEESSSRDYLKKLCLAGIEKKYGGLTKEIEERLTYELGVIHHMGFDNYFLVVWDFIKYAKDNGIMVGPGRGSAAGSIVSYALDITTLDPLEYNLLFERFLNPERISLPDIDCDFCYERRQEVIDYVVNKYGTDHVAQIITFGTMAARGAVRDVGRVMNIPYGEVDKVAKEIPLHAGQNVTIEQAKKESPELVSMAGRDSRVKKLLSMAEQVEGLSRHASTHAAGVVISDRPVTEYVPLFRNGDIITTQFPMGQLEEMGLIKMDFLGLRTLTVIRDAVKNIEKSSGISVDIDHLDLSDAAVFEMISKGDCLGVFQLESAGMISFMRELQPKNFEDIIAGISLYRPGPMDQIPRYIRNKKDSSNVQYLHPLLEPILNVTYGCMVYQEQVMQIFRDVAGFTMGRSDLVRRAMSKKKLDVMDAEGEVFIHGEEDAEGNIIIDGAVRRGVPEAAAQQIYGEMKDFAKYAFNKSHAAAYAVIAYQTAWLKCYYPREFMAALMSSVMDSEKKIAKYIENCKRMGIQVKAPSVNVSDDKFSVVDGDIVFGLGAIKGLGSNAIRSIVEARESGEPFKGFRDFSQRVSLPLFNKRMMEGLIKSGAFDCIGGSRAQLLVGYSPILEQVNQENKDRLSGQISLVDFGNTQVFSEDNLPQTKEFTTEQRLTMEKEVLGVYVSGHPLEKYQQILETRTNFNASMLDSYEDLQEAGIPDGGSVVIGGLIDDVKLQTTKNGGLMAFLVLEDLYGRIEVVVFPRTLEKYRPLLKTDRRVIIHGKINYNEEMNVSIISNIIEPLGDMQNENGTTDFSVNDGSEEYHQNTVADDLNRDEKVVLYFDDYSQKKKIDQVKPVLEEHKGSVPVELFFRKEGKRFGTSEKLWVYTSRELLVRLEIIVGEKNVEVIR